MSTQDKVQLSERERQQLAGIKAMLEAGDPRLARVLTGQKRAVPRCRAGSQRCGPILREGGFGARLGRPFVAWPVLPLSWRRWPCR